MIESKEPKGWTSNAQWSLDVYRGMYGDGVTSDTHATKAQAQGVCDGLERYGFGGDCKAFPTKTWIEPVF